MSTGNGWVKIHRSMMRHWIMKDAEKFRAWMILLMIVDHEPKEVVIQGHKIPLQRGQSARSLQSWGELFQGWERNKVRRFFKLLEKCDMIRTEDATKTTVVTVMNYCKYQDSHYVACDEDATNDATKARRRCDEDATKPNPNNNIKKETTKEERTILPAASADAPVAPVTVTVSDNDEAQSGLHSKPQTGNHTTHRRLFAFADCEAQLLQAGATPSIIDAMRKHYADRLEQLSQRAAIGIMEGLSSEAFSGVNVPLEIAKAAAWEKMNPSKRKTHAGIGKFLSGWMTRVQNSGGSQPSWNQSQSQQPEAPKPPVKMLDTDDYRTRPRPAYFESEAERAMKEHQKKLEQGQQ
jgi:hypothetical protein